MSDSDNMNCDEVTQAISALIDGELLDHEAVRVKEHIATCQACSQAWSELKQVDDQLRKLEPPEGLAERIGANLPSPAEDLSAGVSPETRGVKKRFAWGMVAAIAASIALVLFVRSPDEVDPDPVAPPSLPPSVANVARTSGAVTILVPGSEDWAVTSKSGRTPLPRGARVRTGVDGLAEIETSDEGTIRLNRDTELIVHRTDRIEIVQGQLWCLASKAGPIEVHTAVGPSDSPGEFWSLTCPVMSEVQLSVGDNQATCAGLGQQATRLDLGAFSCPVSPGETVVVDAQRNVQRNHHIAVGTKLWQLPLLAIDDGKVSELKAFLEPMLSQIGRTKASYLNEQQIRALGPPGALPLLAYVISDDSREQRSNRQQAMRLAAGLADRSAISLLERLIADEDEQVRKAAQATLERLQDGTP